LQPEAITEQYRVLPSRLLRQFLTVAERGSLRAAAVTLGVSQPALTKNMRQLEQILGVALFDRHSRGVALTAFGEVLRRRAGLIELEHRYALAELDALRGGSTGTVRIGAGPVWSYRYLPAAIAELHRRYPNARVQVRTGVTHVLYPALLDGEVDLCAGALDVIPGDDAAIVRQELGRFDMTVFVRVGHPLAGHGTPTPQQLAPYPWVMFEGDFDLRQHLHDFFRNHALPPPAVAVDSRSFATGLAITGQGDYLLCLARALEREAGAYGLVRLPITVWEFVAGVCYRRSAAELPFVSLLLHALRRLIAEPVDHTS
jgi:DNA-binding transcriptional LysR family regulator